MNKCGKSYKVGKTCFMTPIIKFMQMLMTLYISCNLYFVALFNVTDNVFSCWFFGTDNVATYHVYTGSIILSVSGEHVLFIRRGFV